MYYASDEINVTTATGTPVTTALQKAGVDIALDIWQGAFFEFRLRNLVNNPQMQLIIEGQTEAGHWITVAESGTVVGVTGADWPKVLMLVIASQRMVAFRVQTVCTGVGATFDTVASLLLDSKNG